MQINTTTIQHRIAKYLAVPAYAIAMVAVVPDEIVRSLDEMLEYEATLASGEPAEWPINDKRLSQLIDGCMVHPDLVDDARAGRSLCFTALAHLVIAVKTVELADLEMYEAHNA